MHTPPSPLPSRPDLVLGVDGGGTATVAMLARADTGELISRGVGGPSNIQAVGVQTGLAGLDAAIDTAFEAAGLPRSTVGGACLGLAGIDWEGGADVIRDWSRRVGLAQAMSVANDATLLLAAGTPDGWGLAVVCGTGSIAFAQSPDGRAGRCGGWGYLLGDEGSGYQLSLTALRAVCRAYDRCGSKTILTERLLASMGAADPPGLIDLIYRGPWDRAAISGMAPVILEAAAEGDALAVELTRRESRELARTAAGAVRNLSMALNGVPIALTGGVILENVPYREAFLNSLREEGITPGPVTLVDDPALGAVVLARKLVSTSTK